MHPIDIDRRTLLRAACTAGFVGVAGCSGGGGNASGGDGTDLEPTQEPTPCGATPRSNLVPGSVGGGLEYLDADADEIVRSGSWRSIQPEGIPLESVDVAVLRRAVETIERLRRPGAAPEWDEATLGELAFPFHRPDLDAPAYYEVEVEPVGSIVLSTGRHDFPVVHVNTRRPPVTRRLARRAEEGGSRIERLYRLDALAFAAENRDGERVATLGRSLVRPVGIRPEGLDREPSLNSTFVYPGEDVPDDGAVENATHRVERSGPDRAQITLEPWESWAALKRDYREVYRVQLEALRRDAAEDWAVYDRLRESGRGIGREYDFRLLYPDAQFRLGGDGADLVAVERVTLEGGQPALRLSPETTVESRVPFSVTVFYPNGIEEEVRFFLVPTAGRLAAPAKGASSLARAPTVQPVDSETTVWTAGTASDQPRYRQFARDGGPDIGPGAVAWAMLFAWADHRACLGSTYWFPRWGLFRTGAGRHPNGDDDAPLSMTGDVRTMIGEINGYLVDPTELTAVDRMNNAYQYFKERTGTSFKWETEESLFVSMADLRRMLKTSLSASGRETPVVIRFGVDVHGYALAWRYKETTVETASGSETFERKAYVNQGDADGSLDAWIAAEPTGVGRICARKEGCR